MTDHTSDCSLHNAPAEKPGPCDCGAEDYEIGYSDGCEDARTKINALIEYVSAKNDADLIYNKAIDDALTEIRLLQGYKTCPACKGTGKLTQPTDRDLISALLIFAGARTNWTDHCGVCHGVRVLEPGHATLAKADK